MNSRPTFQVGERGASPVLLEATGRSSSSRPIRVDSHAVHEQLRGGRAPLLTVIVPVYNEAATIDRLLSLVLQVPYPKQIIVVDDASSDNSAELLRKWAQSGDIELVLHARNQGKGAAIRTALACARGRVVIIQDADLEYDPQDYRVVIAPLLNGAAEVVYGSRRLGTRLSWRQWLNPFYHGVTMLNICVRLLYGVRITDEATCYKAFRTSTLRSMDLACERFEFCPEVTAKACRMGLRIAEVPIRYVSRRVRDMARKSACVMRWKRYARFGNGGDGIPTHIPLNRWRVCQGHRTLSFRTRGTWRAVTDYRWRAGQRLTGETLKERDSDMCFLADWSNEG